MKIISTGIIITRLEDAPINQCVSFKAVPGGFEVLQCCLKDAPMYPEHRRALPCYRTGICVWWTGVGQQATPAPAAATAPPTPSIMSTVHGKPLPPQSPPPATPSPSPAATTAGDPQPSLPPPVIIWKGTAAETQALLAYKRGQLDHLNAGHHLDPWAESQIMHLNITIKTLTAWLHQAQAREEAHPTLTEAVKGEET